MSANEPTSELEHTKLIIFGWITTILGLPPNADPTKYNELTDRLYDLLAHEKLAMLESLIDLDDDEKSLPFGNSLWTSHEVITQEAEKIRESMK